MAFYMTMGSRLPTEFGSLAYAPVSQDMNTLPMQYYEVSVIKQMTRYEIQQFIINVENSNGPKNMYCKQCNNYFTAKPQGTWWKLSNSKSHLNAIHEMHKKPKPVDYMTTPAVLEKKQSTIIGYNLAKKYKSERMDLVKTVIYNCLALVVLRTVL